MGAQRTLRDGPRVCHPLAPMVRRPRLCCVRPYSRGVGDVRARARRDASPRRDTRDERPSGAPPRHPRRPAVFVSPEATSYARHTKVGTKCDVAASCFTSRESLPSRAQLCSRRDIDMTSIVASTASSTASIRVAAPASARGVARGCARVNARHASKRPSVRMKAIEAETVSVESEKVTAFYADQMVDEAGMLAQSTFPIAPEDLIAKCKLILAKNNGGEDPSLLAADFKFVAPVVGPLKKDPFLAAFQSFKLDEGFPDAKFNYYHFRVDPFEPSRVWYDARFFGTNTGDLIGGESLFLFPPYRQLE